MTVLELKDKSYNDYFNFVSNKLKEDRKQNRFKVHYTDGTYNIDLDCRLFISGSGTVCRYNKRKRRYGTSLGLHEYYWIDGAYRNLKMDRLEYVTPKRVKTDEQRFHDNCKKVLKHLSKHNLWTDYRLHTIVMDILGYDICKDLYNEYYTHFSLLRSKDVKDRLRSIDKLNKLAIVIKDKLKDCKDKEIIDFVTPLIDSVKDLSDIEVKTEYDGTYKPFAGMLIHDRLVNLVCCFNVIDRAKIVKMTFSQRAKSFSNTYALEQIAKAMTDKESMTWKGDNGYDVSFEYNADTNRAWYSCEYRGTGNGHYYIALNDTHALYTEDD